MCVVRSIETALHSNPPLCIYFYGGDGVPPLVLSQRRNALLLRGAPNRSPQHRRLLVVQALKIVLTLHRARAGVRRSGLRSEWTRRRGGGEEMVRSIHARSSSGRRDDRVRSVSGETPEQGVG